MATQGMVRQQLVHRLYVDHQSWLNGWLRRQLGCSQKPPTWRRTPLSAY